ncbi:MAG: strawberry notch C-terminal domain-containing protein, partial [Methylococcaceae bacterium]
LEALHVLFKDMYVGRTQLNFHETATELGLNLFDSDGNFSESKIPTIPQFLNRLLSLTDTRQDQVFEEFEQRINDAVEYAKERGTYDEGVQTLKANSIKKTRDDIAHTDEKTGATTRYVELSVENDVSYADWNQVKQTIDMLKKSNKYGGFYQLTRGVRAGQIILLSDNGTRLNAQGQEVHRGALYGIKQGSPSYIDNVNELKQGYTWATIDKKYQKVEISKPIDEADAKAMWNEQIAAAPKTETKTERMIVGVILPIWDRLQGSEKIMRMQADDGEQLLGRMVSAKDSASILKNLGLDSSASKLTPDETIKQIKGGAKAVLANGWEVFTSTVNGEKRIEIKPTKTSSFSTPEQAILKSQGVFHERIAWVDRFFIPTDNNDTFKRITDSKPVVDLLGGKSDDERLADFKAGGRGAKIEPQFSKTQSNANAYTKESLNSALQNAADKEFGKGWFARLWGTSKFKIIDSNEVKAFTSETGVQAFYHNGTTYFVADGIAPTTDLIGLLKHEIGVHALQSPIGKNKKPLPFNTNKEPV